MNQDVSLLLAEAARGDPAAADQLLPLVYDELRQLAGAMLHNEKSGQTLQATALVHEAWLRLASRDGEAPNWEGRRHFFGAAAEAMRRILVEAARRKGRLKHGGEWNRLELADIPDQSPVFREDIVALDEALSKLKSADAEAAELVQLRYFAGLTMSDSAAVLGISERSAARLWTYAKAWLFHELGHNEPPRTRKID